MRALPFLTLAGLLLAAPVLAQAPPTPPPPPPVVDPAVQAACLARFKDVGLPHLRSESAQAEQAPVVCRRGYALSFNKKTLNPDWVIERLTKAELIGTAQRRDNFHKDDLVPDSPTPEDYTNTGRDRGHQAPAADAKFSQPVMDDSFAMTNMSPQVGIGFNRGQWKYLEEAVRAWVLCGGREDIIVMTGPIYGDSVERFGPRKIWGPAAYYKIVYDVRSGRAVGFKLPNVKLKKAELETYVVPIADIEDETGIDFFRALTRRRQAQLETSRGVAWGHGQACSGVVEG
ncbi:DNA/RNA non-specific endonuclease [Caulobacter sp. 1776]|uniref:DNA/RNA non-specific endonuclease n=1 Tax=Caulobacter sp. 1776 TaxID=3156420 RepID=UPI003393D078